MFDWTGDIIIFVTRRIIFYVFQVVGETIIILSHGRNVFTAVESMAEQLDSEDSVWIGKKPWNLI